MTNGRSQVINGAESVPISTDSRERRLDSVSSAGLYSTSGLPSPTSVASGPTSHRGCVSAKIPLGNASPMSMPSPSTPSLHSETLAGPLLQRAGLVWPTNEIHSDRDAPLAASQPFNQTPKSEYRELQQQDATIARGAGTYIASKSPRGRTSPLEQLSGSTRHLPRIQQRTSDSSSIASSVSNTSTGATSIHPSLAADERDKVAMSLPPLSTVTMGPLEHPSSSQSDSSARRGFEPPASRTNGSFAPKQSWSSPFSQASSTGMKFESLQLPLPHNISFGQRPLPRSGNEEKLANIFDLQGMQRNRNTLENANEQGETARAQSNARSLPEPRFPPHRPNLPPLPTIFNQGSHENFLQSNADPLSVLAYAGRIVGQETDYQRARIQGDRNDSMS